MTSRTRRIIGVAVAVVLGVPAAAVLDPVAAAALDRPGPQVDAAAPARVAGAGPDPVASAVRPFTLPAPAWTAAGVAEKDAGSSLLRVETLDRAATRKAGVDGVLLRVRPVDAATAGGKARLDVDGDGRDDLVIWDRGGGWWVWYASGAAPLNRHPFGQAGDIPV
ncbi:hypothetical protein [Virgisporangium aurantiacum]|uniref:Repeat domain-containing protein n=1 Tax=Virgisporangium aurantiacum TaxID=175570 RepID=A0A8J3ZLE9_9ACTN|nr:hypothetical protein [Virgisporangium aurantiacum]GIJ63638.1 hypothetical protein Vau01_111540 [Virgisporangium aurantiacum]